MSTNDCRGSARKLPSDLSGWRAIFPRDGGGFVGGVVGIDRQTEQQDGGDARDHFGEVDRLLVLQRSPQHILFAIEQPFLHHLTAAERVLPDAGGDVRPEGIGVEVNVSGGFAGRRALPLGVVS